MENMDTERAIQEVEKSEQEKANDGKVKEIRKKGDSKTTRGNKKKDPPPPVVQVWEEYPEFNPLEFEPDTDWLQVVSGHELLYADPWWKMDSVSMVSRSTFIHNVVNNYYIRGHNICIVYTGVDTMQHWKSLGPLSSNAKEWRSSSL